MSHRELEANFGWTVEPTSVESSKVELNLRRSARTKDTDTGQFLAIIKVREEDYVPVRVKPRTRLGAKIFTACITRPIMRQLERDPDVKSISISRRLING